MSEKYDYSLLAHNTFGIEARCSRFVEYQSTEEAQAVARLLSETSCPLLIIGGGSNLLLTRDFDGMVVHSAVKGIEVVDETAETVTVRVGSGENWDEFVATCVERGWYGAENLSLIPGEVGASAVQNIGAYGVEASSIIYKVEAVRLSDGQVEMIPAEACRYGYRQSRFKQDWRNCYLITHVTYRLSKTFIPALSYGHIKAELERQGIAKPTARQLRDVIIDMRRQKLPDYHVEGNAGSFFVNPVVTRAKFEALLARYPEMPHYYVSETQEKIPAGWLIEQCGWKGRTEGRAGVHARQALVLVNRGGATGAEVVHLCEQICRDVYERFGIEIKPEVNII